MFLHTILDSPNVCGVLQRIIDFGTFLAHVLTEVVLVSYFTVSEVSDRPGKPRPTRFWK